MKQKNVLIFILFILIIIVSPLFAGGERETDEHSDTGGAQAPKESADESGDPAEPVVQVQDESPDSKNFTHLEQKLGDVGFQLPRESFQAVDFTLYTLEGEEVSLFDYKGKLVFLNFWATWCPPCRAEMPSMERISNQLPADSFIILAVNVNEPKEEVQAFIAENGYTFPVLLDSDGRISSVYQVQGIPTTWLIGPDGDVLGRLVGTTEWDTPVMMEIFNQLIETAGN